MAKKKKRALPEVIQVYGKPYRFELLEVAERNPDGTPRKLVLLRKEEVVDLQMTDVDIAMGKTHKEFVTCYLPAEMLQPKTVVELTQPSAN